MSMAGRGQARYGASHGHHQEGGGWGRRQPASSPRVLCPLGPTSADLPARPDAAHWLTGHVHTPRGSCSGSTGIHRSCHSHQAKVTQWSVLPLDPHHKRSLGRRPPRQVTPLPRAPPGQQGQGRPGRGTQSVGATARPGAAGHHVGLRWEVASRVLAATTSCTPHHPWAEVLRG